MALVMNASSVNQTVQVHGAYFTFTPGQIKDMQDNKVGFLTSNKAYMGFVSLPEELADLEYRITPEGKAIIEDAKRSGIENRLKHLNWLIHNETKSIRNDMDKANMKAEASSEYTTASVSSLKSAAEERKGYQSKKVDLVAQQVDEINKLLSE